MFHRLIQSALIVTLCAYVAGAQTQSNCEPSPPMPPNAKPGISGSLSVAMAKLFWPLRVMARSGSLLALSSDHRRLISLGDELVRVWDTNSWRELQTLAIPRTPETSAFSNMVTISHDGKLIAASYAEFDPKQKTYVGVNAIVWNATTREKLFSLSGHV